MLAALTSHSGIRSTPELRQQSSSINFSAFQSPTPRCLQITQHWQAVSNKSTSTASLWCQTMSVSPMLLSQHFWGVAKGRYINFL